MYKHFFLHNILNKVEKIGSYLKKIIYDFYFVGDPSGEEPCKHFDPENGLNKLMERPIHRFLHMRWSSLSFDIITD